MVVVPADLDVARAHLHPDVELVPAALDDAWMRDIGPTFVRSADGTRLGAVDWVFNGWGAQSWATWEHDARVGAFVGGLRRRRGHRLVRSSTRAAASTSTGWARCCSPRPSSSTRAATRA